MARGQAAESRVFSVSGRVETVETNTSDSEFYNSALLVWDHAMDSKEERESLGSGA